MESLGLRQGRVMDQEVRVGREGWSGLGEYDMNIYWVTWKGPPALKWDLPGSGSSFITAVEPQAAEQAVLNMLKLRLPEKYREGVVRIYKVEATYMCSVTL